MLGDIWSEVASGLPDYPTAVRLLGAFWLIASLCLLVAVPYFKPEKAPAAFQLDAVQVKTNDSGLQAFDLAVRNPTDGPVTVTSIKLEFVPGSRPEGGLQSGASRAVQYDIVHSGDAWTSRDPNNLTSQVTLKTPFDGIDYSVMTIDASEGIEAGKLRNIIVAVPASGVYGASADTVIATVTYTDSKGSKQTAEVTDELPGN